MQHIALDLHGSYGNEYNLSNCMWNEIFQDFQLK